MRARRSLAVVAVVLTLLSACGSTPQPAEAARSKGVKVALVPGGPHPYFTAWRLGGAQAKERFEVGEVTYDESSDWDPAKQARTLSSLGAQGYTAFGVFAVSQVDTNAMFSRLKRDGMVVASLGSCPGETTNKADFCLATDVELAAYKATKAAIAAIGGRGTLVHLTGNSVDTNTLRRTAGVRHAVDETEGAVTLLATVTDVDKDQDASDRAVVDLLAEKGTAIGAIVTTGYLPAIAAVRGVRSSGLPIKIVGIDDDPLILDGIRDGSVAATVVQNPVGQAYVGTWALTQLSIGECKNNRRGAIVDSGSFVVTTANVDTYDEERKAKTEQLIDEFRADVLACA
ncbi:monosaccharide ABC transporter substrate-binding protein, CUT2 family [Actinokineospora alba]|uniref:Monosaccharide ABC transporter substrate-binding protein, CUT2 family n=1 Tax=Actinokineospora alba TaxID=504798 RepID=A0A1H0R003_9PSEU|nr:substrate-binding domain-containing protein [Actinokineospora alba]TDP70312.1 ribose transport system substrate-binding protein [Actinokineospora alba]SDI34409.1 ribose transport system substrate-binding protein [Actinokineospora alba]SDP22841.1 monosaccharide ABC transporter substrate-binding protein, CUT2 family [Actinokineospora alba]